MYGIDVYSKVFQEKMSNLLKDIDGVCVYVHGILVCGCYRKQTDQRLKHVLLKLRDDNVKLNKSKCKLFLNLIILVLR